MPLSMLQKKNIQKDINRMNRYKKRLRKAQVKKQKASYAQINAKARRKAEAQRVDAGIRASWAARMAHEKELKVQACGVEPSSGSLRSCGVRIHLQGKLTQWLRKSSFLVSVSGQEYIIKDEGDKAGLNKGDSVNIVAISTGKRQIGHGLRTSIFEEASEANIEKAYSLSYEDICPY